MCVGALIARELKGATRINTKGKCLRPVTFEHIEIQTFSSKLHVVMNSRSFIYTRERERINRIITPRATHRRFIPSVGKILDVVKILEIVYRDLSYTLFFLAIWSFTVVFTIYINLYYPHILVLLCLIKGQIPKRHPSWYARRYLQKYMRDETTYCIYYFIDSLFLCWSFWYSREPSIDVAKL